MVSSLVPRCSSARKCPFPVWHALRTLLLQMLSQRANVASVTVELAQPLIADSEVMCDLVQDDSPNLAFEALPRAPVETFERLPVDRDLK